MKFIRKNGRIIPIKEKSDKPTKTQIVAKSAVQGGIVGAGYGYLGSTIAKVFSVNSGLATVGADLGKYNAALIKQQTKGATLVKKIPMSAANISDNVYSLARAAKIRSTRLFQAKSTSFIKNNLSSLKSDFLLAPTKKWLVGGAIIGAGLAVIGNLARAKNKNIK